MRALLTFIVALISTHPVLAGLLPDYPGFKSQPITWASAVSLRSTILFADRFEVGEEPEDFELIAIEPIDGQTEVDVLSQFILTFNQPLDPHSLVVQTTFDVCHGTIQLSTNQFESCLPFASSSPALSSGGTIATLIPMPALSFGSNYQLRVLDEVSSEDGQPLSSEHISNEGFFTELDPRCGSGGECAINESGQEAEADYCVLQFPQAITSTSDSSTTVYGRVYEEGKTGTGQPHLEIVAELGYGPTSRNPQHETGWTWLMAEFNQSFGNDDEYQADLIAPDPGDYLFTFRFSFDGLEWTYCDLSGAGSNSGLQFEIDMLGSLTVTP